MKADQIKEQTDKFRRNMKRIKEVMAKSSLKFRYSNSDKSPYYKTQKRTSKIHQRTNVAILDEFIEDDVFTESD